jgi:hypothetical protein
MARADTLTLIPIDRVAYHLQLDPFHFNGITSNYRRNAYACSDTWYQHDWQSAGKLSRESIATALRMAEDIVVQHLQWWPVPQWIEEDVLMPNYFKTEWTNYYNATGRAKSVTASYGFIVETGRKTSSLIDSPATVFSDEDGDGLDETVTITFATTVTEEDELHLYYPNQDGRDEWEIRPVDSITITGGVATIVFKKYLIPLWNLVEQVPLDGDAHILIDGDDNTNFLRTVDVYRVYADTSQQITFTYDPSQYYCSSVPCEVITDTGCLFIRNPRLGILAYQRADWDSDNSTFVNKYFYNPPVKGTIYYRAGKQNQRAKFPNRQMDEKLERLLVYYALSLVDTELCGCCNTRNTWNFMSQDLSLVNREESHVVQWDDLRNPLGTSRAAMLLWKHIQVIRLTKSQAVV